MKKHELQNILRGTSEIGGGSLIQAASRYLAGDEGSSQMVAGSKRDKEKETESLKKFIKENNLLIEGFSSENFVSAGAEQKVFISDESSVFKMNDTIYFENSTDYFHNLLLNNSFFPETAYELKGFTLENEILYAVVQQDFIKTDERTDLEKVKLFMEANGFKNIRNHDYVNDDLGIILEDLHDENVLTKNGILYFIDTVFYIKSDFWNE